MLKLFIDLKSFLLKHYWPFLLLVVVVSYGQLLWMEPWEDDNALFFKLANIESGAGFLGEGPLGTGPYKYTATPYIPIYYLFGHKPFPYFALGITFYFLATFTVYKIFSSIFEKTAGRLVGFLYASGYIASDAIIRIFNSIVTSVSVILISLLFFFYWKFFKARDVKWYIFALIAFFLATELAISRTHYLIAVVVLFEILFLSFEKPIKSLTISAIRILPFVFIFYRYFVVVADQRSGQIKNLVVALWEGEFYQTYSLVSSLTNLIFPDWLTSNLLNLTSASATISFGGILFWLILLGGIIFVFQLLKKHPYKKILLPLFIFLLVVWKLSVNDIYFSPALDLGNSQLFAAFLGGIIFLVVMAGWIVLRTGYKKIYVFFFFWIIFNIAAYAAYNPTFSYISINRYLSHSFFAWVSLLGILYLVFKNTSWKRIFLGAVLLWSLGNIFSSVAYQQHILSFRSSPVRDFYTQLKSYVPSIQKGDVFYFDVADDARSYFRDAFSVAQMPEETAIAWRYGVDRYDIRRVTKFEDLVKLLKGGSFTDKEKKRVPLNNIYTFFYSKAGLVDTTNDTQELFDKGGEEEIIFSGISQGEGELTIPLTTPIKSIVPTEIEITISATALDPEVLKFPYIRSARMTTNNIAKNDEFRRLAFDYKRTMERYFSRMSISTNNEWQDNIPGNLIDKNLETFWRAHRILWSTEGAILTLDFKAASNVNRFIWVNASGSSTPTEYKIQTSIDGIKWQDAREISFFQRIDTKDPQLIEFSPRMARYVRMMISKTTNSDSPSIAEAWVVPMIFSELDIKETEEFLTNPFGYVPSKESYESSLSELGLKGFVQVYWKGDEKSTLITKAGKGINVVYDGARRQYKVILPASGIQIDALKLVGQEIPGIISVAGITARPLSIKEINYE